MSRGFTRMLRVAASSTALTLAVTAVAQERANGELEEVIVTGSLELTLPQELSKYGNEVAVIGETQLKQGGYVDVSQALEKLTPGLYVSPSYGPFSYADISLQGSRIGDVLWVVDGVRINNRLYNTTSPNDTVPAAMIERIEVLKDGQGLYYGTQAVAGVINIVTRGFSDTPGGQLSVGADTNEGYRGNGYYRDSFGPHKVVAYASFDHSDGYRPFDIIQPSTTDRERGYEVRTVGGKYGFDFTDDLSLSAGWQHTNAAVEQASTQRLVHSANRRDEEVVSARLDYTPDGPVQFFLKGYLHDWDTRITTVQNSATLPRVQTRPSDNDYWGFLDYGVNALAKLSFVKAFDTFVGYDYQNYKGRDEVLLIEGSTERVHAVFAQIRTNDALSERLKLALGARYNRSAAHESTTVWNASGHLDLLPRTLFLEAVVGTAFRLPDAYELYAIDPFDTRGNPNLKGEKSRNYNVSLGGEIGEALPVTWRVTGFKRKVSDLIDIVDDGTDFGVFANTEGEVTSEGIDASVMANIGQFSGLVGYTLTDAHAEGSDTQLQRVPKSYLKAQLQYTSPGKGFGGGGSVYWLGNRYQDLPTYGRQQSGDYAVLDLNAHVAFGSNQQQRVNARLENALGRDYATGLGRGTYDAGGFFQYRRLGVPRTLHMTYTYDF